jgi:hypothetical protein
MCHCSTTLATAAAGVNAAANTIDLGDVYLCDKVQHDKTASMYAAATQQSCERSPQLRS